MARKLMLPFALGALMLLPPTVALACHLERVSVQISCSEYKFMATAVNLPHPHSIKYSFAISPSVGGARLTISNSFPVSSPSGTSTETSTGPLKLTGSFDSGSFSGVASLLAGDGSVEQTVDITLAPGTLNCAPPPQS